MRDKPSFSCYRNDLYTAYSNREIYLQCQHFNPSLPPRANVDSLEMASALRNPLSPERAEALPISRSFWKHWCSFPNNSSIIYCCHFHTSLPRTALVNLTPYPTCSVTHSGCPPSRLPAAAPELSPLFARPHLFTVQLLFPRSPPPPL
jgi:hypothetical protein